MDDDTVSTADRNSVIDARPHINRDPVNRADVGQKLTDAAAQIGTAGLILRIIVNLGVGVDASALIGRETHGVNDAPQFLVGGLAYTVSVNSTLAGAGCVSDSAGESVSVKNVSASHGSPPVPHT